MANPRKSNIDRGLRDERARSVFPPKLKTDSESLSRIPLQSKPSKIQRPRPPPVSTTPQQILRGLSAQEGVIAERRPGQVNYNDPWSSYEKKLYLDGDARVIGAFRIKRRVARIIVRVSPRLDKDRILQLLEIQHKHIVPVLEAFQDTDTFLVYEAMHISLDVLIGCGEIFEEPQIARICHELLLAIVNLASKGLQHGNITPSRVLFTSSGVTKLAYIHKCTPLEVSIMPSSRDLWSLGHLILEIVEPWNTVIPKFEPGEVLNFENRNKWSSEANDFLRNTSTAFPKDLLEVYSILTCLATPLTVYSSTDFYET
ncbi:hypothetical protein OIDMADRAFT_61438 [Oidiodendron maius Zn]|uniref:Protein kinase domain-containing protein n=1 Tax=Oidiodendron maius (strain Zn) TaxID=913774 RepID=A0A0C3GQ23_OIDMZ|nr:hypothetical protein OIDMADRAFT_61438 [Oidiodendron maius Zn]